MSKIGELSSLATLILFVLYFITKLIKIQMSTILKCERIKVFYPEVYPSDFNVILEYDVGENTSEKLIICSEVPLNNFKIFKCSFQEDINELVKGELIVNHKEFIKAGDAILINTYLSCGIPSYIIELQRYDYLKGRYYLSEDGRNNTVYRDVKMSHTFLSILFYILE